MTQYYYGEQLRWSLGLDNPNKTAAILAMLVPLALYLCLKAWNLRGKNYRIFLIFVSMSLFWGLCWLLCKTYSRGGLLAACMGITYLIWYWSSSGNKDDSANFKLPRDGIYWGRFSAIILKYGLCLTLALGILLISFSSGMLKRSSETTQLDASVGNRFILWKGALQMAVDRPGGVGWENSGYEYMQWYQPLEMDTGYRTLVNSYLTFLVELGFLWCGVLIVFFLWMWFLTAPRKDNSLNSPVMVCRSGILIFALASFFSTIVEEPWVWPLFAFYLIGLIWLSRHSLRFNTGRKFLLSLGLCLTFFCGLWVTGKLLNGKDPVKRRFGRDTIILTVAEVQNASVKPLWMLADRRVQGDFYGKQCRDLCVSLRRPIQVIPGEELKQDIAKEDLLIFGSNLTGAIPADLSSLILVLPDDKEENQVLAWIKTSPKTLVFLPGSGRASNNNDWWKEVAAKKEFQAKVRLSLLPGVSGNIEPAWALFKKILTKEAL